MKERPILFSTPMVKAILEGRKTVTRRVIKPQPKYIESSGRWYWDKALDCHGSPLVDASRFWWEYYGTSPYGKVGDILWVRETWCRDLEVEGGFLYRATEPEAEDGDGGSPWKPSIHMPKVACRLKLEIVSISVERLHDIPLSDVFREGLEVRQFSLYGLDEEGRNKVGRSHFQNLWTKINGKESWEANPWVWRIEFKKIV